ncbi:unnamed protein product, partial [Closterium sp. Naga37s-1]
AELAKEHLAYAPHLLRLASSFAAQHLGGGQYHTRLTCTGWPPEEQAVQHLNGGRYVAAHWRVEKAMMSHRSPVHMHLWLSGTARFDQHHQDVAIYAVKELYSLLKPTRLGSFLPGLREADLGVQAILDKLLCIKAAVFFVPATQLQKLTSPCMALPSSSSLPPPHTPPGHIGQAAVHKGDGVPVPASQLQELRAHREWLRSCR